MLFFYKWDYFILILYFWSRNKIVFISVLICENVIQALLLDKSQLLSSTFIKPLFLFKLESAGCDCIILPVKGRMLTDKQAFITFI